MTNENDQKVKNYTSVDEFMKEVFLCPHDGVQPPPKTKKKLRKLMEDIKKSKYDVDQP